MKNSSANRLLRLFCAVAFWGLYQGITNTVSGQSQNVGDYKVKLRPDWTYSSDKSSGDYYVFTNNLQKIEVSLKKESSPCQNTTELSKLLLPIIQNLQKQQWIIEQRKPAAPYPFAGQNSCSFMKLKSRGTGQIKFMLNPLVKAKMYQIEITSESMLNDPPEEAIYFISLVSTTDSPALPSKNIKEPTPDINDPNVAISISNQPESKTISYDDLSGFTKVKAPLPAPPASQKPKPSTGTTKPDNESSKSGSSAPTTSISPNENGKSQSASASPNIDKGNIPDVKFSVSDPCATSGSAEGLPWDTKKSASKIEIPKGVEAVTVPIIPNLKALSDMSYNSVVSAAFEAMRLLYGSMPDDEAKKFEAAWTPLFDFPSQEVIDYLNKLNPLVSQFLSCRESYVRSLADMQNVLLDASLAVELKDQHAWEAAMASAGLSSSGLMPLEAAMKQLAQKIETLGNPPNPNSAKCDARNRYKKALGQQTPEFPFEGVWVGDDGSQTITKVAHIYDDGKALVYNYPDSWFKSMAAKGYDINKIGMQSVEGQGMAIMPGAADLLWVYEEAKPGVWISLDWSLVQSISAHQIDGIKMVTNLYTPPNGFSEVAKTSQSTASKTNDPYDNPPVLAIDGAPRNWDYLVKRIESEKWYSGKYDQYMKWRKSPEAEASVQAAVEGPSAKQKRKEEYATKKIEIEKQFEQDKLLANNAGPQYVNPSEADKQEKKQLLEKGLAEADKNRVERLQKLDKEYSDVVTPGNYEVKTPEAKAPEKNEDTAAKKLEAERAEQDRQDAIKFHTEMVQLVSKNLEKEVADRDLAISTLSSAKTPQEAKDQESRIKEFNLRIINIQSNIQAEQDLVASYQTGQVVHTRSVFDEYAYNKMINDMKENAARVDATRRIAQRIDRQIELLPEEIRARARETVRQNIDGKTIASGDIEKARKLANSITSQVQGYAEYDGAMAKVAEVDAQQNEFYAQTTIMAAGAVFMGLGSAALAETFGAEAAMTVYGTQTLGAVWGGTTGLIAGGPKEGVAQAVSWWSPAGYAAVQFVEGYQNAGYQPNATTSAKVWDGVVQAGTAMFLGKVFELGAKIVTKGSLVAFGNESRLFKPVMQSPTQRSKQVLDAMRTTQRLENAKDEIKTYQRLESELAILKRDPMPNPQKIAQQEAQLKQLVAGLNASYYAKWQLKYKADPLVRSKFDRRVQSNYSEMTPGMTRRLEQQGYNMEGIEFRQFRNASSSGTSSMDLDLGPVMKGTMQEPGINGMIRKKDGSFVTMEQFMNDGQQAMNAEYKQLHGISAPSSDMNLVTSVHKEAFSTPKLLDKNIDFSTIKPEEIASIGKVLEVKVKGISDNKMMTNTTKLQAQCRESSKEIENMLIKKLQQDLTKAPAGSTEQKMIQKDINYWEDMLKRFKQIGSDETDPMKIIQLNREILRETGGKDVTGVINDLIITFKIKPSKT
jgi:hypothetical protein